MQPAWKALMLDLSGVLYDGRRPIDGATDFMRQVRAQGLTVRFVTNTATRPATAIEAEMCEMGFEVHSGELMTAPRAAHDYIRQRGLRPYCLIHEALKAEFADIPQHDPDCVLLGDARDELNYTHLNRAFRLLKTGAPLIGIGLNKCFMDEDGLMLDTGAFIHGLAWAAGVEAVIMGKPGRDFFIQVVAGTPFAAGDCLMVGDDAVADVRGAIEAGLQGCLVRTGKYQPGDEAQLPEGARVLARVADLALPGASDG
ncbi:MAG: TIGR01458 family HAD-type hydrolase [Rhodocyclaceae bacterium]|nr:TIGR01458 family HAD-type hydrolase [Rhodocyclaceae bacterium]